MPDLETKDAKVILDLASGQMFSAEPLRKDRLYFEKQGKGDLAYEYASGKAALLCFRGSTMKIVDDSGPWKTQPDVKRSYFNGYYIKQTPCKYQLTTAKGQKYDIKVIYFEKSDDGCAKIAYRKSIETPTLKDYLGTWEMIEAKGGTPEIKEMELTFKKDGILQMEGVTTDNRYESGAREYVFINNKIKVKYPDIVDVSLKDGNLVLIDSNENEEDTTYTLIKKSSKTVKNKEALTVLQKYRALFGEWEMVEAKGKVSEIKSAKMTFKPDGSFILQDTDSHGTDINKGK